MIKLLDDLLIEATCNPNVPGSIVAGLREAVSLARRGNGNPAGTPGAKVDLSRLDAWPQEAEPATVRVARDDMLPPPFDTQEEAQRAAGIWPAPQPVTCQSALDEMVEAAKTWRQPEFAYTTGHADAIPKVSQVRRWAVPTAGTKPTNPKDAAATGRVPLGLLSPIAKAHWALAQHCGRVKYGAWNWREAGARASIYLDAIGRHADGYLSGETHDPADGTHHLGNIMACCAILLEAEAAGKLVDDRPPHLDMRPTYADVERRQADITAKYADRNPKHWTR
jgi:hypothetical protein